MNASPLYRLTGIAIVGFVLMFAYAFHQLVQIQQVVHAGAGKNTLWIISQTEREARKLEQALDAAIRDPGKTDQLSARNDIFHSRIALLNDDPQRSYFTRIGLGPDLERIVGSMGSIVTGLETAMQQGPEAMLGVKASVGPVLDDLGRFANVTTVAEADAANQRRQQQSSVLKLTIMAVGGLMITGAFLIWRLIVNTRTAVSSGAALAEHKARLEAMVAERTAALSEALEKEKSTNEIYRSFITTVSHQFRTPLSIIDMAAQSFIRRPGAFPPEAVAEKAQRIRNACLRLMRMLESTTNAARLDGGVVPVNLADEDLAHIAENACTYQRELTPERRIVLIAEADNFPCRADSALIEQVLLNLLSNAAKYSPAGTKIEVRLGLDERYLRCSVTDHGMGIPEEDQTKIFTRFFRAANAANIPGTGLGLNLSRAIAVLHDGTLDFTNAPGGGTVFTLTLPRRKET